jgi:outer membrane biosynthesis protein TonB
MNGFQLCNHTINVSLATKKGTGKPTPAMPLAAPPGVPPYVPQFKSPTSPTESETPAPPADTTTPQPTEAEKAAADPTNKFVLVQGIDNSVTYESLRK